MSRELLQQLLHKLERYQVKAGDFDRFADEIAALRQELDKPEQEPVARFNWNESKFEWLTKYSYDKYHMKLLYLAPPKQEWIGLTEDEMHLMCHNDDDGDWNDLQQRRFWRETYLAGAKAAQDELKKRNT